MAKTRPNLLLAVEGEVIQNVLSPNVAQRIEIAGGGSYRNAIDFTSMIIEATPSVDITFKVGSSVTVAKSGEDYFIPAYATKSINVGEETRLAVQAYNSGETGTVFISEMV